MNGDQANVLATAMSAIAALAALAVAVIGVRDSRRHADRERRRAAHEMDAGLQARLEPLYPGIRDVCGHLEDGVPYEIRNVLIPFFVLYSDAYAAHRDGLLDDRDWHGFRCELAFWAQKPTSRRAWAAFRQQTWTEGFADHVDEVSAGPPAYPDLQEVVDSPPKIPVA